MKKSPTLLGAHMSIAGGIDKAYYNGASIGCTAIQFFTHSNRQWAMKPLDEESINNTALAQKETGINHAVVHASYLINLGSSSTDIVKKSLTTLVKELERCEELNIAHLVLHPGAGMSNATACMDQISTGINEALDQAESNTTIALETMAGQGTQVGYRFEQLAYMKSNINKKSRIGFCIDTCHIWAAGYDFSTQKGYTQVMHEADTILGLKQIKVFHLSDSKKKLGSRVDRHEELGQGTIGLEAFGFLVNDSSLKAIPKILETPKKELADYAHNLEILHQLMKSRIE